MAKKTKKASPNPRKPGTPAKSHPSRPSWLNNPSLIVSVIALLLSGVAFLWSVQRDQYEANRSKRVALRELLGLLARETQIDLIPFSGGAAGEAAPEAPPEAPAPSASIPSDTLTAPVAAQSHSGSRRLATASTLSRVTGQRLQEFPSVNLLIYLEAARDLADELGDNLSYVDHLILGACAADLEFETARDQFNKSLEQLERKNRRTGREDIFGRHLVLSALGGLHYVWDSHAPDAAVATGRECFTEATDLLQDATDSVRVDRRTSCYLEWIELEREFGNARTIEEIRRKMGELANRAPNDAAPPPPAPTVDPSAVRDHGQEFAIAQSESRVH